MSEERLKLTSYFSERDSAGRRFIADAFSEIYERHELETSLVLRGVAGFGARGHFRTDRQLSLSEDLPIVSVAVDTPARIQGALSDIEALRFGGLVTQERALMPSARIALDEPAKLTVYLGRQERIGGRAAHHAIVDLLHRAGVAGATVFLGVDGTAHGARRRAKFFARNAEVPLMVVSVGDSDRIAEVLPALDALLARPRVTLERIQVCKRDGMRLAQPSLEDGGGWQKLMVYASEQAQHDGHPLYASLLRRLRAAGAGGATSLRGIWGYHGDHAPHGDTLWQLRRRVPVVTVIVDEPARIARWFEIVDEVTEQTGLVTSEAVPVASVHHR